jgi:hypothetical protein
MTPLLCKGGESEDKQCINFLLLSEEEYLGRSARGWRWTFDTPSSEGANLQGRFVVKGLGVGINMVIINLI